jgi:hypothetical protein
MEAPMKGIRIVKPRTAKQRAHAQRAFNRTHVYASPGTETMPTSSWWSGLSREQLQERVEQEQPRMKSSRFGRVLGSGVTAE